MKAHCDILLASKLENRTQTIMSPQVDVQVEPGEVKIPHRLGWGLSSFCLGLVATPALPCFRLASWEGAQIWEVAAQFPSCVGSVLTGRSAASPLPSPALLPARGFWQEPIQPGGWKSLASHHHSQFCDTVKLISGAVKLLPVGQRGSYQKLP